MSTIKFKTTILTLMVIGLLTGSIFAQQGKMGRQDRPFNGTRQENCPNIPDLTEEQKEQIKELKTDHLKATLSLKNQVQEKKAHLQTISTGDNVDMNEVNTTIEQIGNTKVQMAKKRAAHRQQIRSLLTDDQLVFFDSRQRGRGNGSGSCNNRPRGRMNKRERF